MPEICLKGSVGASLPQRIGASCKGWTPCPPISTHRDPALIIIAEPDRSLGAPRLRQPGLSFEDELARGTTERPGNAKYQHKRGRMLAALDLAHVRALDAGHIGESLLRDPIFGSNGDDSCTERLGRCSLIGCRTDGSASLNFSLLHRQERRI